MSFDYPYAGLILPDAQDLDPGPYLDSAARILTEQDPRLDMAGPVKRADARVMGAHLGICVVPEEQSDYGPRVVLEVVTEDGSPPDDTQAAKLLSDTVREALKHSSADILEWYAPDILIDREDFLRLKGYVSPRRLGRLSPEIEDTLFDTAAATQSICKTLYPDPDAPCAVTPPVRKRIRPDFKGIFSRFGGMGLKRMSQTAAVTSLYAILATTGQWQMMITPLWP